MLIGISTMLAIRTGMEEFQVGEDEMSAWLGSAQKVARHYSIETTQRTLDWIAFVGISGQVFGTRAVAIAMKARQQQKPSAEVRELRPAGGIDWTMSVEQPDAG